MDPTFSGFIAWVQTIMGVPAADMPTTTILQTTYDEALNLAYNGLQTVPSQPTSPSVYATAVYNLGGALLVEMAQDVPPSTYWNDLRKKLNINAFSFGIISSASDQGTSETLTLPAQVQGMTLFDLQLAKSPWGRTYLMLAGSWGAIWDMTV
jgi:hypothetical protein